VRVGASKKKEGKRKNKAESMHQLGSRNRTTDDIATRSGSKAAVKQQ
jgi:hypothetical protein